MRLAVLHVIFIDTLEQLTQKSSAMCCLEEVFDFPDFQLELARVLSIYLQRIDIRVREGVRHDKSVRVYC